MKSEDEIKEKLDQLENAKLNSLEQLVVSPIINTLKWVLGLEPDVK